MHDGRMFRFKKTTITNCVTVCIKLTYYNYYVYVIPPLNNSQDI